LNFEHTFMDTESCQIMLMLKSKVRSRGAVARALALSLWIPVN